MKADEPQAERTGTWWERAGNEGENWLILGGTLLVGLALVLSRVGWIGVVLLFTVTGWAGWGAWLWHERHERRRLIAAARASEERFKKAFDLSPLIITVASLAMMKHWRPATSPMPPTTPAPTNSFSARWQSCASCVRSTRWPLNAHNAKPAATSIAAEELKPEFKGTSPSISRFAPDNGTPARRSCAATPAT